MAGKHPLPQFSALSRRQFAAGGLGLLALGVLDACSRARTSASATGSSATGGSPNSKLAAAKATPTSKAPAAPVVLSLDPADGAAGLSPAAPITVRSTGGSISSVTLSAADGTAISGVLSAGETVWTASQPLAYKTAYRLTASAVNADGVPATAKSAFGTLTPGNMTLPYMNTRAGNTLTAGETFGVGMVVRVHFDEHIPDKAAAEKALAVTTTPAVTGSWYWLDDQDVLWRPQSYYPAGTKVTVAANVLGVEVGPGLYGQQNVTTSFTIGPKHVSIADDTNHQVAVYFDDVLQRSMPTSMGKHEYTTGVNGQQISFYTPPGVYTVLDKSNPVLMSSASYGLAADAPGGYAPELINWATRISTDGIYLHELESTLWAQGNTDTSHGCLNLNQVNATWFYQNAQVGDVVQVKNTGGAALALWQNGDWTLSWAQWLAGSALQAT